jgi:hypothetical protein
VAGAGPAVLDLRDQAVLAFALRFPAAELLTCEPERVPFTMDEKLVSLRVRLELRAPRQAALE